MLTTRKAKGFGPDRVDKFYKALEAVWSELKGTVSEPNHPHAREVIGAAITRAAQRGETKFKQLRAAGMRALREGEGKARRKSLKHEVSPGER